MFCRNPRTIAAEFQLHSVLAQHLYESRADAAVSASDPVFPRTLMQRRIYFVHVRLRLPDFGVVLDLKTEKCG